MSPLTTTPAVDHAATCQWRKCDLGSPTSHCVENSDGSLLRSSELNEVQQDTLGVFMNSGTVRQLPLQSQTENNQKAHDTAEIVHCRSVAAGRPGIFPEDWR